jgi:hypothetical protein
VRTTGTCGRGELGVTPLTVPLWMRPRLPLDDTLTVVVEAADAEAALVLVLTSLVGDVHRHAAYDNDAHGFLDKRTPRRSSWRPEHDCCCSARTAPSGGSRARALL